MGFPKSADWRTKVVPRRLPLDSQQRAADPAVSNRQQHPRQDGQRRCIAAMIENVKREVGLAVFDPNTLTLHLAQYIETGRGYASTRLLLNVHLVTDAVLVESADRHQAFAAGSVSQTVEGLSTHSLPRRSFDDTFGLQAIMTCGTDESQALLSHAQVRIQGFITFKTIFA